MQLHNVTSVWLLLAVLALVVHAEQQYDDKDQQAANGIGVSLDMNGGPDPLTFGAMESGPQKPSLRHRIEKIHLMKKLERKATKCNVNHPRYRLLEALYGYAGYRERSMAELNRWRNKYSKLPKRQRKTLESVVKYKNKLDNVEELIGRNEALCNKIMANAMSFYGIEQPELDAHIKDAERNKRKADRVGVTQALKHFVRDWSEGGLKERSDAFPCVHAMLEGLGLERSQELPLKVLVPGAGLGRLAHEVASKKGYEVTTNEWSMYMNIAYRYLTNHTTQDSITLHPFIDSLSHKATTDDLLREVISPNYQLHPDVLLVEGDFTAVFSDQSGHYDIIITHFFIDTATNLMTYFETIQRLLKKGGKWINFGPLLYGTSPWVQLSLDEIIDVVEHMGFVFENIDDKCGDLTFPDRKVRGKEAEYGLSDKDLTKNAYKAQAWVATKL